MRTVIKNRRRPVLLLGSALILCGLTATAARADNGSTPAPPSSGTTTYLTTRSMLAGFFPKSEHVTYKIFALTPAQKARLGQRLGYSPAKDHYTIFVATTGGKIDGYALVDEENGQHLPITFATRLSPRGVVERLEVMAYREPRGDEVRDSRFLAQFAGKTTADPIQLHRDIDAVSGATISSASLATGVRRAAVLVEELALGLSTFASGPQPAPARGAAVSR